ncbi:hypothetical protein NDU88_003676 [Pleurodeles waltl]|uniref:Uncharacterized protein n=1 Tax=Pleurodeles waltl TaxID=8319 RepID=A0AAV7NHC9_PLEWA|nr:hypothetical protein NDU88_003676 [Pleurodeles waltl]
MEERTGDLADAQATGRHGTGRCSDGHSGPVCIGGRCADSLGVIGTGGEEAQNLRLSLERLAVAGPSLGIVSSLRDWNGLILLDPYTVSHMQTEPLPRIVHSSPGSWQLGPD